ncbi:PREDICTED: agamous-like MADS-box protein AGL62 [Lupinus angustifolius]|uniref:agamous-like MADS-box protein AGL62 n=1 Tax=Lupinus angustifolius TaxID=3871 RepID=UPI00092F404E|nr:PREDICTED: agamous-like MADS-box protein AGL62 [Lupinus angustifolius]
MSNPKRSQGRRKIEMKKITKKSNLQVTFTKRRKGLFQKASELSTLCGAEITLIVFSPGEKAFSFGHPSVNDVIDRYQMRAPTQNSEIMNLIEAHRSANVRDLNEHLTRTNAELEMEKKRSDDLNQMLKEAQAQSWLASPIDAMNIAQLDQLKLCLEVLKKSVTPLVEKQHAAKDASLNPPSQVFSVGSSSNNRMLLHQPPCPPPSQVFHVPQQQVLQNHPSMLSMMMHHPNFNNVGGFGPGDGFF